MRIIHTADDHLINDFMVKILKADEQFRRGIITSDEMLTKIFDSVEFIAQNR